tara:strand:- start:764 stop:1801 length:1038 start_codon:yes stop_codon:yes gene_type:complete
LSYLINPYLYAAGGDLGLYQELGRHTNTGASAEINVTGLADKPYLMILAYYTGTGTTDSFLSFNGDEASNYANRYQRNYSGSDSTDINQGIGLRLEQGDTTPHFNVSFVSNIQDQEKLVIGNTVRQGSSGAANSPNVQNFVGKWDNTTDVIDQVTLDRGSDNFSTGSELIVLGYDPTGTGSSVWENIADEELTSSADEINAVITDTKKYMMVQFHCYPTGSDANPNSRTGVGSIDSGSNYAALESVNGGGVGTPTSSDNFPTAISGAGQNFANYFIVNDDGNEKIGFGEINTSNPTGAGSAPQRKLFTLKYDQTGDLNRFQVYNGSDVGGNDLDAGSSLRIWGMS